MSQNDKLSAGQVVGNVVGAGVDTTIGFTAKLFKGCKSVVQSIKDKHQARMQAKEDALVEKVASKMKDSYSCEISPEAKKALRVEIAQELHTKIVEHNNKVKTAMRKA